MDWPRAIIHVDMDAFFVSVERKNDPSLAGKPVIVGGGPGGNTRRGVVCACSYETRPFGVRSAMPLTQALALCPQAILIPVGRSDYSAETARVRQTLQSFTDLFEMASQDEAYVDLQGTEGLHGTPIRAADALRRAISENTGLPVSMGLATSKTVAKIASKLSKPRGLFVVFPGGEAAVMRPFPIRMMPGLGPRAEEFLKRRGIRTLGELAACDEEEMMQAMGDWGAGLVRRARGECDSEVASSRIRQQISKEETFAEDVGDADRLHAELTAMATEIGAALRTRRKWAGTLALKIRYPDFTTQTRQMPLRPPSHDDQVLLKTARALLKSSWDRRRPLRLLGLGVSRLADSIQEDFLDAPGNAKQERLLRAMDAIRRNQGSEKIIWGTALRTRAEEK